jgi:hypothetical protein
MPSDMDHSRRFALRGSRQQHSYKPTSRIVILRRHGPGHEIACAIDSWRRCLLICEGGDWIAIIGSGRGDLS